jgi:hypothetical protein
MQEPTVQRKGEGVMRKICRITTRTKRAVIGGRRVLAEAFYDRFLFLIVLLLGGWCSVTPAAWAQQLYEAVEATDQVWTDIEAVLMKNTGKPVRFVVGIDTGGNVQLFHKPGGAGPMTEAEKKSYFDATSLAQTESTRIELSFFGSNPGCGKLGGDDSCFQNEPRR